MADKSSSNPFIPEVEVVDQTPQDDSFESTLKRSLHPVCLLLHIILGSLPLVIYIFGGLFLKDAQNFVFCIILIAMDFYFVQNFSGRYLVGMRWWPVSSRDASASTTKYEVTKNPEKYSKAENRLFWMFLLIPLGLWIFFAIASLISLTIRKLIICVMAICLTGTNVRAYYLASRKLKENPLSLIPKTIVNKAMERVANTAMSFARSTLS